MKNGIICIETEWEHTTRKNQMDLDTQDLLEFLKKSCYCEIIYRRVATRAELCFYLQKFGSLKKYSAENYPIFYFSFHGYNNSISLEGEDEKHNTVTLEDLAKYANGAFAGRIVHFSSCRTMSTKMANLLQFKKDTGISILSGYTKSVNGAMSAIHDLAYFHQLIEHPVKRALAIPAMERYYQGAGEKLGFKIV